MKTTKARVARARKDWAASAAKFGNENGGWPDRKTQDLRV